jgi:hypothetical protein
MEVSRPWLRRRKGALPALVTRERGQPKKYELDGYAALAASRQALEASVATSRSARRPAEEKGEEEREEDSGAEEEHERLEDEESALLATKIARAKGNWASTVNLCFLKRTLTP